MANKDKTSAEPNSVAQVSERVRNSSNILVALSKDPSIDELTAALSLALILDKFGKHATAIFSGTTPNIISFLQPEKTFETDTNSLQDFIIALDKEKADHIRYKIDGDFVKVFITPYKTTIDEKDLEFSHGDFNVDLVIALNVKSEAELDSALVEYGRIMHDASSINISPAAPGSFGDIEWGDPMASSVSEMIYRLAIDLQDPSAPLIDDNIATTILTGVISATNRFSNERTTADTLSVASNLLASGANQQLIAKNIPVDILTAQPEPEAPAETPVETPAEVAAEAPAEPEADPVAEPVAEPVVEVPAAPVDPTNFSIEHQKKDDSKPKEEKAEKEAPKADAQEAPEVEPAKSDAKSETARIVEQAQRKQADEKAKAEAEEKRKKEEQAAKDKAEAEKNQAAKEAIVARVKAEHSKQDKPEAVLPPQPPKNFATKSAEPKVEAPKAAEVAEAPKAAAPEAPKSEPSEPTVIPNAVSTDGTVLPPPPAPSTEGVMPPAVPAAPAPTTAPTATSAAVAPSEPTVIPNAVVTAPVMPSVTMPSQESVTRAMNPTAAPASVAPTQSAQAPATAAPTLAPRPAMTPTSPVAPATPTQPAQAPAQSAAPAANPINDPGAFHIPGM